MSRVCRCGCGKSPCVMLRRKGESQDQHDERVREAIDEVMLDNPVLAHMVHSDPLSEKYKRGEPRQLVVAPTTIDSPVNSRGPREPTPYEKRKAKARRKP